MGYILVNMKGEIPYCAALLSQICTAKTQREAQRYVHPLSTNERLYPAESEISHEANRLACMISSQPEGVKAIEGENAEVMKIEGTRRDGAILIVNGLPAVQLPDTSGALVSLAEIASDCLAVGKRKKRFLRRDTFVIKAVLVPSDGDFGAQTHFPTPNDTVLV